MAGQPRRGLLLYCVIAAAISIPFMWRTPARKPMLFALVSMLVTWGLMLFGRGTGGSVHHTALLWPWPQFLVAVAGAELSRRFGRVGLAALVLVFALVCGQALLVSNTHLSQFARNGAPGSWTDAVYALSDHFATASHRRIVILDWGIFDSLQMLRRGELPLVWGGDPLQKDTPGPDDLRAFSEMVARPDLVFVSYTGAYEQIAGVNQKLREMLARIGACREILAVIPDSNGRPVYEVFRIRSS